MTIVYDNYQSDPDLRTDWGFGCVVDGFAKTILFDTGTSGQILLSNMSKLQIDPQDIDVVVLSHIHGDHTGGLAAFLDQNAQVTVFAPQSFPSSAVRYGYTRTGTNTGNRQRFGSHYRLCPSGCS